NRTADLAFVHPVGYVLANHEAKATIVARNLWHGKSSFTSRIFVRADSGLRKLEDLRSKTIAFVDPASSSGYIYPMVLLIQRGLVQNRDPKTFFREVGFSGAHPARIRMDPMIEVAGLSVVLPPATVALQGIDLAVRAGEFVVILGKSGAGKTTFLRSINRLVEPTTGVIRVAGRAVTGASGA